jgi:hypothetical protein
MNLDAMVAMMSWTRVEGKGKFLAGVMRVVGLANEAGSDP